MRMLDETEVDGLEQPGAAYFSLPIIGAGVGIGAALDAALRKTVFLAPGRNGSNRVAIAPSLSSVAWGAHLTLGW